jgi:hypothetical protein
VPAHGDGQAQSFNGDAAQDESRARGRLEVGNSTNAARERKKPAGMTSNPAYFMVVPS